MKALPPVILIVIVASFLFVVLRPKSARAELKPGDLAPDFSTQAIQGGQMLPVHLADYRGKQVVLYFYPKDNTPGCTREACAFRDGYGMLQQAGIILFGCSVDSAESHAKFIKKYNLPFPLLLDPDKKIAKSYGADNGIPILGLDKRITYVIGADGRIMKVYPDVDPATNAREIIHDLGADKPHPRPSATPPSTASGASASMSSPQAAPAASQMPRGRTNEAPGGSGPDDIE